MFSRDFTFEKYESLLNALVRNGYCSRIPFGPSGSSAVPEGVRAVILRHDVDRPSPLTLRFAELEHRLGWPSIYYFRAWGGRFEEDAVSRVAHLGHEVGYHYETLSRAGGNLKKAFDLFRVELAALRRLAPVKTACMHGAPLSRWDNRMLWESYDYRRLGIEFEPYFDLDFKAVLYLTDTGRRWDGERFSVRDRVQTGFRLKMRTTDEVIETLNRREMPSELMINCHPHRWDGRAAPWLKELFWQNAKNLVKRAVVRGRARNGGLSP
jgi:hypothetical protein